MAADLFAGPGEMRTRGRAFDWAVTPLGPVSHWPESLRTSAAIFLGCSFPMILVWGSELIQLYNDAYIPLIGAKHPHALGVPTHTCWPEIRQLQEPIFTRVFHGETVQLTEAHYALDRRGTGMLEDADFDATFIPVPLISGTISELLRGGIPAIVRVLCIHRGRLRAARGSVLRKSVLPLLWTAVVGCLEIITAGGRRQLFATDPAALPRPNQDSRSPL